ncbi:MAG TPA: cupin domain-containing protein [Streptosporangiaceae bacterium]|nr:cupin domain-containing protein [Streptosporangiaceae bacterium]
MQVISGAGEFAGTTGGWAEQLRVADLSVGTYSIPAGGTDTQEPHTEDEIYLVTAGRAVLESGGVRAEVRPGSVIYVPAGEVHRFAEIAEDLAAIVVFAPAEYSRARA